VGGALKGARQKAISSSQGLDIARESIENPAIKR
jgi:hypothetical protein